MPQRPMLWADLEDAARTHHANLVRRQAAAPDIIAAAELVEGIGLARETMDLVRTVAHGSVACDTAERTMRRLIAKRPWRVLRFAAD